MPQRSFYRWHLLDPILFEKDLKVTLQQLGASHGGLFERQDDVATTAYWYQTHPHVPFAPLMSRKEQMCIRDRRKAVCSNHIGDAISRKCEGHFSMGKTSSIFFNEEKQGDSFLARCPAAGRFLQEPMWGP